MNDKFLKADMALFLLSLQKNHTFFSILTPVAFFLGMPWINVFVARVFKQWLQTIQSASF
jgi:hypothetical protein